MDEDFKLEELLRRAGEPLSSPAAVAFLETYRSKCSSMLESYFKGLFPVFKSISNNSMYDTPAPEVKTRSVQIPTPLSYVAGRTKSARNSHPDLSTENYSPNIGLDSKEEQKGLPYLRAQQYLANKGLKPTQAATILDKVKPTRIISSGKPLLHYNLRDLDSAYSRYSSNHSPTSNRNV